MHSRLIEAIIQKFNCDKSSFDFLEKSKLEKKSSISVDPYACSYVANCISEIRTKLNNVFSKLNLATGIAKADVHHWEQMYREPKFDLDVENEISNSVS